jgi:hypothetical protein
MISNAYETRNFAAPVGQVCTLYSNEKSQRDLQNSSIIKIGNYRKSPCHSSPNFKDNDELAEQDYQSMTKGGFKIQEFERPESTRMTEPDFIGAPEQAEVVPKTIDFAS